MDHLLGTRSEERDQLKKRLAELDDLIPMETPKESKKAGKQMSKLIKEKEAKEREAAQAALIADQQVSLLHEIERRLQM
jgi:hypothetical protein